MRDATRGGLGTVVCELAAKTSFDIRLYEEKIPVNDSVQAICEVFGFDPLFLANEGKVLFVVPEEAVESVLTVLKANTLGHNATVIGEVLETKTGRVSLKTFTGGQRWVDMPAGAQLPRIC
jgi:hydrogenase expression/formation protein HypE